MNPVTTLQDLIAAAEAGNWGTVILDAGNLLVYIGTGLKPLFGGATEHAKMMTANAPKTREEVVSALKTESDSTTINWQTVLSLLISLLSLIGK